MHKQLDTILKTSRLSVTESRKKILDLFLSNKGALSHNDIEKKAAEKFDRVTIYRTLQTFVDRGIIHTVPTDGSSVQYALCRNNCSEGHHRDDHIHFVCDECSNIFCMDDVSIPVVRLPKGFTSLHTQMVVTGICKDCK